MKIVDGIISRPLTWQSQSALIAPGATQCMAGHAIVDAGSVYKRIPYVNYEGKFDPYHLEKLVSRLSL